MIRTGDLYHIYQMSDIKKVYNIVTFQLDFLFLTQNLAFFSYEIITPKEIIIMCILFWTIDNHPKYKL